jgi:hypothetical protein
MVTFSERLKTRVPGWQRFFERVRADVRNPAYDLLPVLSLDQRNAFSKTLATFSPKTSGFILTEEQAILHDQLRRDGLTARQTPLPANVLGDLLAYFKATPCHDPYRAHLGAFPWDVPASIETNIGYYTWEEVLRAPHMIDLMNQPDILAVAESYIGCKPVIDNIGATWSYPGREAAIIDTFGAAAIARITAPAETWFLEDVYGFHKGQLPADRPRLLLAIEYNLYPSPLSPKQPLMARDPQYDPYINKLFLK